MVEDATEEIRTRGDARLNLIEFASRIAGDADPSRAGHQVSALYVVLCLVVPAVMGLFAATAAFVLSKLARRRSLNE